MYVLLTLDDCLRVSVKGSPPPLQLVLGDGNCALYRLNRASRT